MVSTRSATTIELLLSNVLLVILYILVLQDVSARIDYSRLIGFNPSISYLPLSFVLSAVRDGTSIPGLLTFDWSQFFLIALIIMDGSFLLESLLGRKSKPAS